MENSIIIKELCKNYYLFDKDYKKIFWLFSNKGHYSMKKALDNLSLTVKKGEVIGIIGRNGAGKSTLMRLIAGITFPTSGEIIVKGSIGGLINLSAGFNGNYTGRENIYYKSELLGLKKAKVDEIMNDIIEFADIGEYFDLPLKTYSSGMRARLGFSLAINLNPDILIIDEVFAVGDRDFKRKSAEKTRELFLQGKTIVFSSHSDELIRQFCSRVVFIKNGKVEFDGNVDEGLELYNNDKEKRKNWNLKSYLKGEG